MRLQFLCKPYSGCQCRSIYCFATAAPHLCILACRAFQNSKALSHAGLHMAFVAVLKKCQGDQETDAACFAALRKLACNDKLCIELGEAGVVLIALKVQILPLRSYNKALDLGKSLSEESLEVT